VAVRVELRDAAGVDWAPLDAAAAANVVVRTVGP